MNKKTKVVLLSTVLATELVLAGGNIEPAQKAEADITAPVFTKAKYKYVKKCIREGLGSAFSL